LPIGTLTPRPPSTARHGARDHRVHPVGARQEHARRQAQAQGQAGQRARHGADQHHVARQLAARLRAIDHRHRLGMGEGDPSHAAGEIDGRRGRQQLVDDHARRAQGDALRRARRNDGELRVGGQVTRQGDGARFVLRARAGFRVEAGSLAAAGGRLPAHAQAGEVRAPELEAALIGIEHHAGGDDARGRGGRLGATLRRRRAGRRRSQGQGQARHDGAGSHGANHASLDQERDL
jgi:hypothetical protein